MSFIRRAGLIAAICLIALLTCCGRAEKANNTDTESTGNQADAVNDNTDLAQDSEQEETGQEEILPSTDLFWEDGAVCTQFYRLMSLEGHEDDVTCHYFQEPEAGRYELDIIDNASMTLTEGTGGRVFAVVLSEECPEEAPGEKYDYLGTLSGEDGKVFHVLLEYPEGAQYTEGSEASYSEILRCADNTARLLEGRNGFTFEAGEYPGNTEE